MKYFKKSTEKEILRLEEKIKKRNIGIDILRGFSILLVLLLHLNIHFGLTDTFLKVELPKKLFSFLFWSGFYGVIVFFTLSGYLITSSILNKWQYLHKIDVKSFYVFRLARILPLLLLLILVLSVFHIVEAEGFVINTEKTSLARAIFSALTFHINWLEIQVGYLPANWDILWSISIEETFYLFFPLLCLFLKKRWQFVIVLLLFLIVSPWARTHLYIGNELGDRNHLAFLDSIALGCMVAIINKELTIPKWLNRIFLILGLSMLILIFLFKGFVYKNGITGLGVDITILSIGTSLILFWMYQKHTSKRRNYSGFNWLRPFGLFSYEIYLTHMFVVIFGAQCFRFLDLGSAWLIPTLVIIIILSYLLGKLIFYKFSEPLNILLREKWAKRTIKKNED